MIIERTVDTEGNVIKEEVIEEKSPWMTINEAATYLRMTNHTIHEYWRMGLIRKFRIGDFRTIRVPRADVEGLIKNEVLPTDEVEAEIRAEIEDTAEANAAS